MAMLTNQEIWENYAVSIAEACQQFGVSAQPDSSDRLRSFAIENSAPRLGILNKLAGLFSLTVEIVVLFQQSQNRSRKSLLDQLQERSLICIGYRRSPSRGQDPVEIDKKYLISENIGWFGNRIEVGDRIFVDVRIYDPSALPPDSRPKIGRPGAGQIINEAIDALMLSADGSPTDFCRLLRKEAAARVREYLKSKKFVDVSGSGFSKENITKYIIKRCRANNYRYGKNIRKF